MLLVILSRLHTNIVYQIFYKLSHFIFTTLGFLRKLEIKKTFTLIAHAIKKILKKSFQPPQNSFKSHMNRNINCNFFHYFYFLIACQRKAAIDKCQKLSFNNMKGAKLVKSYAEFHLQRVEKLYSHEILKYKLLQSTQFFYDIIWL